MFQNDLRASRKMNSYVNLSHVYGYKSKCLASSSSHSKRATLLKTICSFLRRDSETMGRPWTPRFESHISPYKVSIPLIVEIKNKNQWLGAQVGIWENWARKMAKTKKMGRRRTMAADRRGRESFLVSLYIAGDRLHGQMSVWMEYNLHTLPAIVFMKRGQEVDRVVGVKFDELERKLHKYAQSFFKNMKLLLAYQTKLLMHDHLMPK
ncbi:BnaC06g30980D [Brassica napus]|uniref:(rape) hypothetical protein n=1 Tax=Brassica napus TaxID=3708 RepID=A0A078FEG1_BRANA|nr:unnamed protein product [Brassica napus]CDY11641.1 BnaC06g30980D [Brassica napus]